MQNFGTNYVSSATHDNDDLLDAPKWHPGTRTSFLSRLSKWVEDANSIGVTSNLNPFPSFSMPFADLAERPYAGALDQLGSLSTIMPTFRNASYVLSSALVRLHTNTLVVRENS